MDPATGTCRSAGLRSAATNRKRRAISTGHCALLRLHETRRFAIAETTFGTASRGLPRDETTGGVWRRDTGGFDGHGGPSGLPWQKDSTRPVQGGARPHAQAAVFGSFATCCGTWRRFSSRSDVETTRRTPSRSVLQRQRRTSVGGVIAGELRVACLRDASATAEAIVSGFGLVRVAEAGRTTDPADDATTGNALGHEQGRYGLRSAATPAQAI
jgi:hypothetical protein